MDLVDGHVNVLVVLAGSAPRDISRAFKSVAARSLADGLSASV